MKQRLITAAGIMLWPAIARAAPAAEAAPVSKEMDFLEIVAAGGIMMYPLGILSVLMGLMILMFLLTIRRNAIVSDNFMNTAEAMIRRKDLRGLLGFSLRRNECIARISHKTIDFALSNPGMPFENIREVAQTEGTRQAGVLTSRITYLAEIGAIAPMIGLLGTVLGMIKSFLEIASGGGKGVREMGLAEGVSEALIATAGGLGISIIAFVFYSIFRSRVQKYVSELEAAATHLVALLHAQFDRRTPKTTPRIHDDFAMPVPDPSPLAMERPDIHGI